MGENHLNVLEIINSITNEFEEISWYRGEPSVEFTDRSINLKYYFSHFIFFRGSVTKSKKIGIHSLKFKDDDYIILIEGKDLSTFKDTHSFVIELNQIKSSKHFPNINVFEDKIFKLTILKVSSSLELNLEAIQDIISFKTLQEFQDTLILKINNWNDYGYYKKMDLYIWDCHFEIRVNPRTEGMIRYLKGTSKRPNVVYLSSIGGVKYYRFLKKYLSFELREEWFKLSKDLAFDISRLDRLNELSNKYINFLSSSFLRTTNIKEIKDIYFPLANYKPQSKTKSIEAMDNHNSTIEYEFADNKGTLVFKKNTFSKLPMRIYGIVGGNGSGKSYKIRTIIKQHLDKDNRFSQIIHFSLSPFDENVAKQIEKDGDYIVYERIGFSSVQDPKLKNLLRKLQEEEKSELIEYIKSTYDTYLIEEESKIPEDGKVEIKDSFIWYIQLLILDLIASDEKLELWNESLSYFSFDKWADKIRTKVLTKDITSEDFDLINCLSSGQAAILLYLTKLVFSVNPGSLVIFDEPEIFMHPPMMKAFTRAVSHVIQKTGAFCLLATHSPVVIQEIPHCNVYKIDSEHRIERIHYKTYGQNLDTLYKNIYGVALQMTGYNSLLTERLNEILEEREKGNIISTEEILYSDDMQYLGDEAYLKYLIVKDIIETE